VVEVLEDMEVTDEVAGWAASAVQRGCRLALDDYFGPSTHDRIGGLASYVKVDVLSTAVDELP
jgi:c-di-GMP-related signal transduction protein